MSNSRIRSVKGESPENNDIWAAGGPLARPLPGRGAPLADSISESTSQARLITPWGRPASRATWTP